MYYPDTHEIFFSTFFTIVVFSQANAQDKFGKGYYVTNNLDTVYGYVEHRSVYRKDVNFRLGPKGPIQKLTSKEVAAFGFDGGSAYLRVNHQTNENLPSESIFVKPLVNGEIDLYFYDGKMVIGSNEKGRFALGKKTSDAARALKNDQNNKAAFSVLLYDCPTIKEEA
ncbi:MAG TPA: hypothetical protein VK589_05130, partial [Chryseolinea sp.]|nr:hypothetical protein [Chryseolinea sp.]